MLFAIGTKVRFRFTGETGVITALFEDGMLQVRLTSDPDIEIPTFEEDLVRDTGTEPVSPGAKFVQHKPVVKADPPPRREVKGQYVILKSKGIQLGFEPMPGKDGTVSKYKAWLINDTKFDVLVDFQLYVLDAKILNINEKLTATTALDAGDILFDHLNDAPEVEFSCQRFTTAGLEDALFKDFKIKAKQFFNNLITAPILNVQAYHFVLIEDFTPSKDKAQDEDLKSYTKQKVEETKSIRKNQPNSTKYNVYNVEEFAHFEPEIDLHIEKLSNGYAKMDKSMALRIQLKHFEQFMDKAIRLGVPRVFIIHGLGEGKLKEAIADRLRHNPAVHKFKNEYHAKYGYGATEVIF